MDILKPFSIPIKGLKNGVHEFDFHIGKSFFEQFEGSPIKEGQFDVHLNLEKRHDMLELNFDFSGTVPTECDRCLSPIHLPVSDNQDLLVKFSIVPMPEDAEVVYISPDAGEINVARYIYEFISLSMPYNNRYVIIWLIQLGTWLYIICEPVKPTLTRFVGCLSSAL